MLLRARVCARQRAAFKSVQHTKPVTLIRPYSSSPLQEPTAQELAAGRASKRNAIISLILLGTAAGL